YRAVSLSFLFVCACQPQTRQDRAAVGPDVTPVAGDPQLATPVADSQPNTGTQTDLVSLQWESTQKSLCESGKPASCSALAYEALRSQQTAIAQEYFTRACLLDVPPQQCGQNAQSASGLARACHELSFIYRQQGKNEDADKFKICACDRGFRPACGS
ncbi:MAG: hypothetical protein RL189_2862, partial [Pseudomonadota bacterium]